MTLAAAFLLFLALPVVAKPHKSQPTPAPQTDVPAPVPVPVSPLQAAQTCYGQGNLGGVLELLAKAEVPPAEASERLRLLAIAAARLDRHADARTWFAAWVQLSPSNRLERQTTLPIVYQDYTAALLASRSGELDWTPHIEHETQLLPMAVTPTEFPRFVPPPRGQGVTRLDIRYALGVHGSLPVTSQAGAWSLPWKHLGVQLALDLSLPYHLSIGAALGGWQRPNPAGSVIWNPSAIFRAGWGQRWGDHGLDLFVGGGVALASGQDTVIGALAPALRYSWKASDRPVGFYAELASETLFGSDRTSEVLGLTLGVLLQPIAP